MSNVPPLAPRPGTGDHAVPRVDFAPSEFGGLVASVCATIGRGRIYTVTTLTSACPSLPALPFWPSPLPLPRDPPEKFRIGSPVLSS
jgi:hypothetical protein